MTKWDATTFYVTLNQFFWQTYRVECKLVEKLLTLFFQLVSSFMLCWTVCLYYVCVVFVGVAPYSIVMFHSFFVPHCQNTTTWPLLYMSLPYSNHKRDKGVLCVGESLFNYSSRTNLLLPFFGWPFLFIFSPSHPVQIHK